MFPLAFLKAIPTKVWAFLAIMLLVGTSLWMFGNYRFEQGAAEVQKQWDQERLSMLSAHASALAQRAEENVKLAEANRKALSRQKKRYEDEIAEIKRSRAAADSPYGLRVPRSICDSPDSAGPAKADGTQGGDGPPAGTVVLPEQVERNLRGLMEEAATIVARCRLGQEFIRENGFEEK